MKRYAVEKLVAYIEADMLLTEKSSIAISPVQLPPTEPSNTIWKISQIFVNIQTGLVYYYDYRKKILENFASKDGNDKCKKKKNQKFSNLLEIG